MSVHRLPTWPFLAEDLRHRRLHRRPMCMAAMPEHSSAVRRRDCSPADLQSRNALPAAAVGRPGTEPQGSVAVHAATAQRSSSLIYRTLCHRACSNRHSHINSTAAMDCLMAQVKTAPMHHLTAASSAEAILAQTQRREEQFRHRHQQRQEQRQHQARAARKAPCAASAKA